MVMGPVVVVMLATLVIAEPAVLTGLRIRAGERGIAVALEADRPFEAAVSASPSGSGTTVVTMTLPDAIYGLSAYTYDTFNRRAPVTHITASNETTAGGVELSVELRGTVTEPIKTKHTGNRMLALVSDRAVPPFAWHAPAGHTGHEAVHGDSMARESTADRLTEVTDIRVVRRDRVDEMIIETNRPPRARARQRGNTIVVVFEGAISAVPAGPYRPGEQSVFEQIHLQERQRERSSIVGVSVRLAAPPAAGALARITQRGLTLIVAHAQPAAMSFWSARTDTALTYEFVDLPAPALDSAGMAARARQDLQRRVSKAETFAVGTGAEGRVEAQNASGMERPAPDIAATPPLDSPPPAATRMVVIRDDVNVRAAPIIADGNVLAVLPMGTRGTAAHEKGAWFHFRTDEGVEGWIYASMVAESSAVTPEQWAAIEEVGLPVDDSHVEALDTHTVAVEHPPPLQADSLAVPAGEPKVVYQTYGRDPFLPLDQLEGDDMELPDVETAELVGIMYDDSDRIALLEDGRKGGGAFALRERDPIQRGRVLRILPRRVVFLLDEDGIAHTYSLYLENGRNLRGK
jgi:hypothetical protein